ncbi:hypothetical protein ACO0QE_000046 [Hanseniaspora vineae]
MSRNKKMEDYTLEEIPSFYPTEEEFSDPIDYLSQAHIMKNGMKYGMIKLIPPESFKKQLSRSKEPTDGNNTVDHSSIMEASKFKFRIRQQNLSRLNLLNRCRLSFANQLESYKFMMHNKRVTRLPYIMVCRETQRVYLYDLYISIIRYYNDIHIPSFHETNSKRSSARPLSSNRGDTLENSSARSKRRKLNNGDVHNKHDSENLFATGLQIPSPEEEFLEFSTEPSSFWYKTLRELLPTDFSNDQTLMQKTSRELYHAYNHNIKNYLKFVHKYQKFLISSKGNRNDNFQNYRRFFKSNGISSLQHDPATYQDYEFCAMCDEELEDYSPEAVSTGPAATSKKSDYLKCRYCRLNYHKSCTMNLQENKKYGYVCENCLFGNGYYGFDESEKMISLQNFKTAFCFLPETEMLTADNFDSEIQELEHEFWHHVNDIDSKLNVYYGADIHNEEPGFVSGFENEGLQFFSKHPMNLMNLPYSKGSLLDNLNKKISGMTTPWIYVGSKFSTFCWHLEDQYTLSCNYQFEGAPKIWYSIPPGYVDQFNTLIQNIAPDYFIYKQPDLLHQLTTLLSPYDPIMKNSQIQVYKAVQKPGEFIITYPKCYHAGFNAGYNFNEAVNFTLNSWIPFGLEALTHYKITKRKCVFDMWDLIWKILDIATTSEKKNNTRITVDNLLVRTCYYELLKFFNESQRKYYEISKYLNDAGSYLASRDHPHDSVIKQETTEAFDSKPEMEKDQSENSDVEAEEEPLCSHCKTICSFFFVVQQNNHNEQKRQFHYLDQLLAASSDENSGCTIICLDDYISCILDKEGSKPKASHRLMSKGQQRKKRISSDFNSDSEESYDYSDGQDSNYKSTVEDSKHDSGVENSSYASAVEDGDHKKYYADPASHTTLYFTRSFAEITGVLKKAERYIERM